jgi:CheY-like chemotaxis protein
MTPTTNSPDRPGDEPSLPGEERVEYGGELIWAVDFTAGGAPIGLASKEFRAELEHRAGWARAKALLAWAFEACSSPVADIEVGRVKKVGEGLFRKVYAAHVDLSPDPDNLSGGWAILLPDQRATTEDCGRWVREVTILRQLARERLLFRVPAPLGAFPDGDHPAIIRRFIDGIPVDLRAGRMPSIRPAQLVGRIAAAIHAIDVTAWRRRPPGAATRRAHAEELMRIFDDLEGTDAGPAREWAVQHLPQDRAAVLVHGDLLGQNILMFPDQAPAVIDWEFCRIDLVLLDPTMPRMDGGETLVELRKQRPDVRVILMSGYDERQSLDSVAAPGLAGFLRKPFLMRDLVATLRGALED